MQVGQAPSGLDERDVARRCREWMAARDRALAALGVVIESVTPGAARMRLAIGEEMLNSQRTCHGGVIFTLADCAFGYACNSRNRVAFAADCTIDFVRPGRAGDVLTAVAEERYLSGRNGLYEITVTNQDGEPVAFFRGRSRIVDAAVVEGLEGGPAPAERGPAWRCHTRRESDHE